MGRFGIMVCVAFAVAFGGVTWAMRGFPTNVASLLPARLQSSSPETRQTNREVGRETKKPAVDCNPLIGLKLGMAMAPLAREAAQNNYAFTTLEVPEEISSELERFAPGGPCAQAISKKASR